MKLKFEKIMIFTLFLILVGFGVLLVTDDASISGFAVLGTTMINHIDINEEYSLGGLCSIDSDCLRSGNFYEYCGIGKLEKENPWTDQFPQVNDYTCKCVNTKCAWIK